APKIYDGTSADGSPASGIAAWMAVLILARELAVTALRGFIENQGGDFSAMWAGKWKMVFQCLAVCFSIGQLRYYDTASRSLVDVPAWTASGLRIFLGIAIILTAYSGAEYIWVSIKVLRRP